MSNFALLGAAQALLLVPTVIIGGATVIGGLKGIYDGYKAGEGAKSILGGAIIEATKWGLCSTAVTTAMTVAAGLVYTQPIIALSVAAGFCLNTVWNKCSAARA